ncbi:MAG: N-acetylmuramoyl-L-alanine amidase [Eubacteriales bacterium]|nr:N-acetylmuramoyl-L-alanine amidase [Eubacteriales bacterium]
MKQIAYNITKRIPKIEYIVIHDTGNPKKGADAENHFRYFNGGNRDSSADFFVDDKQILQVNDYNKYYTWHCGDGKGKYGITNSNSIGIEICINPDGNYDVAFEKTIELTKKLMAELKISADRVVRHYDASRKNCPASMNDGQWSKWHEFKKRIEAKDMSKLTDINGHYAQAHIEKLEKYGIVNGDGQGKFNPDDKATRADVAIMIANALNVIGK